MLNLKEFVNFNHKILFYNLFFTNYMNKVEQTPFFHINYLVLEFTYLSEIHKEFFDYNF
jgi:hypothetical protein